MASDKVIALCYQVQDATKYYGGSPPEVWVIGYFKSKAHIPLWLLLDVYNSNYYIREMNIEEAHSRLKYGERTQ